MNNHFGLKSSAEGIEVESADLKDLLINTKFPLWKCDLRATPKRYGFLKTTTNLAAGEIKNIFRLKHGLGYQPTFLVAWNYPAGTAGASNQTFGNGSLQVTSASFETITFEASVTEQEFKIEASNEFGVNAYSNLYAEFRFYIFNEDFPKFPTGTTL